MRHLDWRALVAIILTLGIAASIVILSVLQLVDDGHVTETESTLLATVLGAGIGAIATYLGLQAGDDSPHE